MKKIAKAIVLVLIVCIGYFAFDRCYVSNELPSFEYAMTNNASFTNDNVPYGKKTVFIYFTTDCPDCKAINNYLDYFKSISDHVTIVLVAKETTTKNLIEFFDIRELSDFKGYILLDQYDDFPSDFDLGISYSFPVLKAYDENQCLIPSIRSLGDLSKI
ncbi:hypothetical protein [Flavobacterium sp.]|uniref:TlpA family protein disulfide reductase n=1 Tax=Flavobacterium sp. TaxID=239 RepID=UPI0026093288|nr:hypothetical protein [Flavobacterium sp.]